METPPPLARIVSITDEFTGSSVPPHCGHPSTTLSPRENSAYYVEEAKPDDQSHCAFGLERIEAHESVPLWCDLDLNKCPQGKTRLRIHIQDDRLGKPIAVPAIVAKGKTPHPILGITVAVHGDELNGVPAVFDLLESIDTDTLRGTLAVFPMVNPPGVYLGQREFLDKYDLNRCFPGRANGKPSNVFAHRFMEKVLRHFEFNIDLHTASAGRENTMCVRADMTRSLVNRMAAAAGVRGGAKILTHSSAIQGCLREAATTLNIPSIVIELGNPTSYQKDIISRGVKSMRNIMKLLKMLDTTDDDRKDLECNAVVCSRSFWVFADYGGLVTVFPEVGSWVAPGEVMAEIRNEYGDVVSRIKALRPAIMIGRRSHPVCASGERVVHLGVCEGEFPSYAGDGHEL